MTSGLLRLVIALLMGAAVPACTRESPAPAKSSPRIYVSYPERIDPACRDGKATLFDECGDQIELFKSALARAKLEKKVLLVEFGAEWCIWCHVFDTHVNGEHTSFEYTYGAPEEPDKRYSATFREARGSDAALAPELRQFVADHFVIAHVDGAHAPNGYEVLELAGADRNPRGIPYIFSVDATGRFAKKFDHDPIEKRRDADDDWYRGYDRRGLLKQLAAMRDAALAGQPGVVDPVERQSSDGRGGSSATVPVPGAGSDLH